MLNIILFISFIIFISTGIGVFISKKFNYKVSSYYTPIGFIILLFTLQITYYPLQYFSLDSKYLMLVSLLVLFISFIISIKYLKDIIKSLFKPSSIWILVCLSLFLYIFYHSYIGMELTDTQVYLNYITQNINIEHLGQFNFTNGKLYDSPDVFYLYQGYYYFASFMCWLINAPYNFLHIGSFTENITIIIWGLGSLYSIISTMFILEVVSYFNISKKKLMFAIIGFATLVYNFYYWRVAFAFYGNTFRTLLVGMLIFELFRRYQKHEDINLFIIVSIIGAGLATSSSFLFISFDIVYLLMAYMCCKKIPNTFKNLSIIVSPIVVYALAFISYYSSTVAIIIGVVALLYYILMATKRIDKLINFFDNLLVSYGNYLFLIGIPILFIIHSIYIMVANPYYEINFFNYFANHADYDMTVDPFATYGTLLDKFLTLLKWIAVIFIVVKSWKKEDNYIGFTFLFGMLIFLNPLTITSISVLYTYNVYYRAFDIILNPFTVVLFILTLDYMFSNYKYSSNIICLTSIASILVFHLFLYTPIDTYTSYSFHYQKGKEVDPITKLYPEELEVLEKIRSYGIVPQDEQITVISQLEGFKTFFPNAYQIFARAQYFYPASRVNEEFFQMAKRQYSWLERPEVDYSKACKYIEEYDIDMAVINDFESFEFDQATDKCMETIIKTDNYHVKVPYKN